MKHNFSFWLLSVTLLIAFDSCNDHSIPLPTSQQFRIKKSRTMGADSATHSIAGLYKYDSNNRLVEYVEGNEKWPTYSASPDSSRTLISYDAQGRVQSTTREAWIPVSSASLPTLNRLWLPNLRTSFAYDLAGHIAEVKIYAVLNDRSQTSGLAQELKLAYDGTGVPVKRTIINWTPFSPDSQPASQFVEQYTYTNGNISSVVRSDNGGPAVTMSYQYDDKPNPFYGLVGLNAANSALFDLINRNNIIAVNKYYSYDSMGLLTKVAGGDTYSVQTYDYETY